MGGACSRKRDQQVSEDSLHRGVSGRYSKSASSKWLGSSFSRGADAKQGKGKCPSLMELCIHRVCEVCIKMIYQANLASKLRTDFSCTSVTGHR